MDRDAGDKEAGGGEGGSLLRVTPREGLEGTHPQRPFPGPSANLRGICIQ